MIIPLGAQNLQISPVPQMVGSAWQWRSIDCAQVVDLETACIQYLEDIVKLPFYPSGLSDCAGPKHVFCQQARTGKPS